MYAREGERFGADDEIRRSDPDDRGWMALDRASVDGDSASVTMRETLARVDLPHPLAPGDSLTLRLHFVVKIPKVFDRFGHQGDSYSISQWYPKLVVLDREGWALDPFHYFAEFYGEFADYDVSVTLPDAQWVGATGVLVDARGGTNDVPLERAPAESVTVRVALAPADSLAGRWPARSVTLEPVEGASVTVTRESGAAWRVPAGAPVHYRYLWDDGAASPDLERDDAGRGGPLHHLVAVGDTSIVDTLRATVKAPAPADSALPSLKTLRFRAERVHDFAWVASPRYVRADSTWDGIAVRTLLFREDVGAWRGALSWTVRALEHHRDLVGPYVWPQFTTAEAFNAGAAMEYPMLTMNDPGLVDWELESIDDTLAHEAGHSWFYGMLANDERRHPWLDEGFTQFLENDYIETYYPRGLWRHRHRIGWVAPASPVRRTERSLLQRHYAGDEQRPASPADSARSYAGYSVAAYDRPAAMLRSLRAVWGEETFRVFLAAYYRRGLLHHVRPEDVYAAAREAAGESGPAFVRPWIETTGLPDVARGPIRRERTPEGWRSTVRVRRRGGFPFAVPVEARFEDGSAETKVVRTDAAENDVIFESRARLREAVLDPDHRVLDAYALDDQRGLLPPMRWAPLFDFATAEEMTVLYGPTLWHGTKEGMRLGGWVEGRYLPGPDFPRGIRSFEAGWNVGVRHGDIAWRAGYARRAAGLGQRGSVRLLAARDVDHRRFELSASNWVTENGRRYPWRTWQIQIQDLDRAGPGGADTLLSYPGARPAHAFTSARELSAAIELGMESHSPGRRTSGRFSWRHGIPVGEGSGGGWARSYDRARVEWNEAVDLGARRTLHVESRLMGGWAWRAVPGDRLFDAAQSTPLETLDRFYLNRGGPLRESDHFWSGGGGGLRGYVGRSVLGDRIAAASLEARHGRWPLSVFADAGRVARTLASGTGANSETRTLADAGFGCRVGDVRLYAPLWVGSPEPGERPWDVRWVITFDLADTRFR